jgi:hypothetical protein
MLPNFREGQKLFIWGGEEVVVLPSAFLLFAVAFPRDGHKNGSIPQRGNAGFLLLLLLYLFLFLYFDLARLLTGGGRWGHVCCTRPFLLIIFVCRDLDLLF